VIAWLDSVLARLVDWQPVRRLLESCLRLRAARHFNLLCGDEVDRPQARLLRGLVHRARHTRFGKDHDFGRIRTALDFRRLVPVTTPADLARRYWEPAFPWLARATWPGSVVRVLDRPFPGCPYLPVTNGLLAAAATVWTVGLAQVLSVYPRQRLLSNRLLGLADPVREPLTVATWGRLSWTLRPYLHLRNATQLDAGEFRLPTTALLGSVTQLAALVRRCQEQTGLARLTDAWPGLLGVLVQREPGDAAGWEMLLRALDRRVVVVEVVAGPLGIFAVEDVRQGGLRLLVEGGAYNELIPLAERGKEQPERCGLEVAEPGTLYEQVTTTPSGLWACRTGVGLCFDGPEARRVRFVDLPALPAPGSSTNGSVVVPATSVPVTRPVRHRQSAGIPVTPPGTAFRMPSSTPLDRG
jgi:hypothetical protein